MGALKILTLAWIAVLTALPAFAIQDPATDRAMIFAACLGRYSAAREHAWLMGGADPAAEAGFEQFDDLLAAVIDDARQSGLSGARILARRIDAKMAQAKLLQAAQFQTDARHRRISAKMADRHLATCNTLVIG